MARLPQLHEFCRQHGLKMCTIEDLIKYRRQRERLIRRELTLKLPTHFGAFDLIAYTSVVDPEPHLALCLGGGGVEASSASGIRGQARRAVEQMMHFLCRWAAAQAEGCAVARSAAIASAASAASRRTISPAGSSRARACVSPAHRLTTSRSPRSRPRRRRAAVT